MTCAWLPFVDPNSSATIPFEAFITLPDSLQKLIPPSKREPALQNSLLDLCMTPLPPIDTVSSSPRPDPFPPGCEAWTMFIRSNLVGPEIHMCSIFSNTYPKLAKIYAIPCWILQMH